MTGIVALDVVTVKLNGLPARAVAELVLVITGAVAAPAGSAAASIQAADDTVQPVAVSAANARATATRRPVGRITIPSFVGLGPG